MRSSHLQDGVIDIGGRIKMIPVQPNYADGLLIAHWRNTERHWYFDERTITPSSHIQWCKAKSPLDEVWMVYAKGVCIGMTSLTLNPDHHCAEYGRTIVDPLVRGKGYGTEIEYTCMLVGFELFTLSWLTGELYPANPIAKLHDAVGWRRLDVDTNGHLHIACDRDDWRRIRQNFVTWMREKHDIQLDLGELE